jgi:molybdopterin-guanine dinucleotide biosynthesis protein A
MDIDDLKITGFYRGLKTMKIEKETIKSFDPEGKMFINVNTRKDLEHISSL